MNKTGAKKRLDELRKLIDRYSYEYYILDKPSVSDAIYDGLWQEYKKIENDFPELITPDSPTQRVVGTVLAGFKSVEHRTRMLSLNDVFDQADVEAWIERTKKLAPDNHLEFFADIKM